MDIIEEAKKDIQINDLLSNLLTIYEKIGDATSFVYIKFNIESLDINSSNYKKLVEQTNTLIDILNIFGNKLGEK